MGASTLYVFYFIYFYCFSSGLQKYQSVMDWKVKKKSSFTFVNLRNTAVEDPVSLLVLRNSLMWANSQSIAFPQIISYVSKFGAGE